MAAEKLAPHVLIAKRAKEKKMVAQQKQTPLDMLVISQLAAIRRAEAALEQRRVASPAMEASHFAAEVWKLQASADRLGRMIDAMNLNQTAASAAMRSQTVA